MVAPGSRIGPATEAERSAIRSASLLGGKYDRAVDRESAYEVLLARANKGVADVSSTAEKSEGDGVMGVVTDFLFGSTGPRGGRRDGVVQSVAKSMVRRAATQLLRGVLGSLTGRR